MRAPGKRQATGLNTQFSRRPITFIPPQRTYSVVVLVELPFAVIDPRRGEREGIGVAKETVTRLIDDLDGGEAHETVTFGLDGHVYQIDLSTRNAKKLRS